MAKDQSAQGTGPGTSSGGIRQDGASRVELDLEAMRLMGKRNVDAAWAINRLAVDCVQRCAERQTEVWSKFSANALGMLDVLRTQSSVATPTVYSSPAITDMIETILDHMRALSETIARANQEALDVMSNRSEACFREVEEAARRNLMTLIESGTQSPSAVGADTGLREKRVDPVGKS